MTHTATEYHADEISKDEFVKRFIARMVTCGGEQFDDGSSVEDYARETVMSFWEDASNYRLYGPEQCADADMSYWGE